MKNALIYSGPSMIDGSPIVCIAIGQSGNTKTGAMIQTHIIRADINPLEASKTGADVSICGDCVHRGKPTSDPKRKTAEGRSCYVNLGQGPNQVYKAFKRGAYGVPLTGDQMERYGADKVIRMGSYGDPSAVPEWVWHALLKDSKGHTGYTHQHSTNTPEVYSRAMYSADSQRDAILAHAKGYRTFRVIPITQWETKGKQSLLPSEILCPASKENDKGVTCSDCMLCGGSNVKGKSIAIVAHGVLKGNFKGD